MNDIAPVPTGSKSAPVLSSKVYDTLKWIALIFLPAFGAFYFALAAIWGLPYAEQVLGTSAALDTLLGALLSLSTRQYNKSDARFDGQLVIEPNNSGPDKYSLELDAGLDDLAVTKKEIVFKVNSPLDPTS